MRIARIWMVVGSIAVTFAASTSRADDASQTDNSDAGDVALSTDGSEDAPPGDDGTNGEPIDCGIADAAEEPPDASLDGAVADAAPTDVSFDQAAEDAPPGDDGTDGEPPLDRPIGRPLTPRNPARSTRRAS